MSIPKNRKGNRWPRTSRRKLLAFFALSPALAPAKDLITVPGKRPLLLHNDRPEDLETPASYFSSWITPNDIFFVRQHLPRPRLEESTYRLAITGRVSHPRQLTLADLRNLPQHRLPATLECAGNGRAFFQPRVPACNGCVAPSATRNGPARVCVMCLLSQELTSMRPM